MTRSRFLTPSGARALRFGIFFCTALSAGCWGQDYMPDITLAPVRTVLDGTAEFHQLYPAPNLVSGKDHFGLDTPDAKRIPPSELAERVETEVLTELEKAGPFLRIARFLPHPDVVVTGQIHALHERTHPKVWTKIPGLESVADAFDLRTHVSSGEADLTLIVLTPNGDVVGRYRGTSSFNESFNPTADMPPGARLNRALSEAVKQIQSKLARDADLRRIATR